MVTRVKGSDDLKQHLKDIEAQSLVLLQFSAKWCSACSIISPEIEKIAQKNPIIKCFLIDVDDCEDLATEYNVVALPTIHFLKGNSVLDTIVGAKISALYNILTQLHPEGILQVSKDDKEEKDELLEEDVAVKQSELPLLAKSDVNLKKDDALLEAAAAKLTELPFPPKEVTKDAEPKIDYKTESILEKIAIKESKKLAKAKEENAADKDDLEKEEVLNTQTNLNQIQDEAAENKINEANIVEKKDEKTDKKKESKKERARNTKK